MFKICLATWVVALTTLVTSLAIVPMEESQESKLRRQAVQAELQKLYEQMEQEKTNKKNHPLQTLIDKL